MIQIIQNGATGTGIS